MALECFATMNMSVLIRFLQGFESTNIPDMKTALGNEILIIIS